MLRKNVFGREEEIVGLGQNGTDDAYGAVEHDSAAMMVCSRQWLVCR